MVHLLQFGHDLTSGSEERVQTRFIHRDIEWRQGFSTDLFDPGDLEKVKITKI